LCRELKMKNAMSYFFMGLTIFTFHQLQDTFDSNDHKMATSVPQTSPRPPAHYFKDWWAIGPSISISR